MLWILLLFFVCGFLILLMPMLWMREIYSHYRGTRAVTCPETHRPVAVRFRAFHAAITGFARKPDLRLATCTLWPRRPYCRQECIPEAMEMLPYTRGEVERPRAKKIYHLPVLLAAFVAWVLGAIWHSQYIFRGPWMKSLGLSRAQLRPMVWSWSPHLLSVAVCALFAYGVAWLLMWSEQKGVGRGISVSTALWMAIALASLAGTGLVGIPRDLLRMELGYTLLASVVVGAVVGGVTDRLLKQATGQSETGGQGLSKVA